MKKAKVADKGYPALGDLASQRAVLDAITRLDFPVFIRRGFNSLSPGARFLPNWHIEAMAFLLERVRLGKTTRLIINMPPRSLKSIVTSVAFPAFLLGHDPTKRVICVSYGSDLATKHANDCRSIMRAEWYRKVFPGTRISSMKDTESEFVTTQNGYRLTTSLDGTLTGRGGDTIIIDDPLKPADATSDARRERVNEWYHNTLLSRLDDKVKGPSSSSCSVSTLTTSLACSCKGLRHGRSSLSRRSPRKTN